MLIEKTGMDSHRTYTEDMAPKNAEDFEEFQQSELEELYSWIDSIPLSRPKRNINRDFSDGVLVAEVVKHALPKFVELHNYAPANSTPHKIQNWALLNRKVFSKLRFQLSDNVIKSVAMGKVGVIEKVLLMLRVKISKTQYELNQRTKLEPLTSFPRVVSDKPEADQNIHTGHLHHHGHGHGIRVRSPPIAARTSPQHGHSSPQHGHSNSQTHGHSLQQKHSSHHKPESGTHFTSGEMIPRILLEEKEQENLAKEETIQILQAKIKRLEHLVHLKDVRIDDLQNRMEQIRPTGSQRR